MTGKADFTEQEWKLVLEGPSGAGLIVVTAQRGGSIRETFAMAKAYAEARQEQGQSELLGEIEKARPVVDHTRYPTMEKLREEGLKHLKDAIQLLEQKATPDEVDGYRRFVLTVADRVASAHREAGQDISPAEQEAIDEIASALGQAET